MPNSLTKTFTVAVAVACALASAAHAAITISTHKTNDENCSAGVCTPTGPNPNIRVKDLETLLAHSDVKIVTGQGSTGIGVLDPLTWASSHRLTLDANQSIHIRAPVMVEGTGGVTLITNDGGTGGDYEFDAPGALTFWDLTSSLIINGQSFTLVTDIKTLASDIAANASGNYALAKNYDATVDGTYNNSPVATIFHGTFEGLGNQIQNFSLAGTFRRGSQDAALFAYIAGSVRDIALTHASIMATDPTAYYAAALAVDNAGVLTNVTASGTISNTHGVAAGLAGYNDGTIIRASTNVSVRGTEVGGLVYDNRASATISQSFAAGSATGTYSGDGGGLAADNHGTITDSHAAVGVSGDAVGGLVGINYHAILRCSATGDVTGTASGGLVAGNGGRSSTIAQSYATGSVHGPLAGGLVAGNGGTIAQSYAIGSVGAEAPRKNRAGGLVGDNANYGGISESYSVGAVVSNTGRYVGGFIGKDGRHIKQRSDYWDLTTSGIDDPGKGAGQPPNDPGITGLTDVQLKTGLPAGFDPNVWGQSAGINNGWPYLLANPPPQ